MLPCESFAGWKAVVNVYVPAGMLIVSTLVWPLAVTSLLARATASRRLQVAPPVHVVPELVPSTVVVTVKVLFVGRSVIFGCGVRSAKTTPCLAFGLIRAGTAAAIGLLVE